MTKSPHSSLVGLSAALSRRTALGLAGAGLAAPAFAQTRFPARPIQLIVPWPPGTSADMQLRSLAEVASTILGQPIVIENRSGASGTLHAQPMANARPDGYMLGHMHMALIRRPFLVRQPQWNAVTDFTHILRLAGWTYGVAVRADSPYRTWSDLVAAARRDPGKPTFATSGIATTNHMAMEDLTARENVQFTHVPFRGSPEGLTAVLGGQVDCIAENATWAPHVEAGRMRLLCVWTPARLARFPDVPTLKELGHDLVVTSPYGISGPKGMDPQITRVLHDAFKTALFSEQNGRVRTQYDMPEQYLGTADYTAFVAESARHEEALVRRLGITIDG